MSQTLRVPLVKGATTECFRLAMIDLPPAEVNDDMAGSPNGRGIQPAPSYDRAEQGRLLTGIDFRRFGNSTPSAAQRLLRRLDWLDWYRRITADRGAAGRSFAEKQFRTQADFYDH
jgi:hypothetical protein